MFAREAWKAALTQAARNSRLRLAAVALVAVGSAAVSTPASQLASAERAVVVPSPVLAETIESGDEDHFHHDEPAPVSPAVDLAAGLNEIADESPWAGRWGPEIEPLASYEPQGVCLPGARPAVAAFASLLQQAYPQSRNLGITRACEIGARSEHKEGRAYDWGVNVSAPDEREAAHQMLAWLLATDEHGNEFAMARRLGVMYVIWDNHIWSSTAARDGWRLYTGPSPHTDHVHLSFNRAGAMGQTSFWDTGSLDVDFGALLRSFSLDDFPSGLDLGGGQYRSELGTSPGQRTSYEHPNADGGPPAQPQPEAAPAAEGEDARNAAPPPPPDEAPPDEAPPAPAPVDTTPLLPLPDPPIGPSPATTVLEPVEDVVGKLEDTVDGAVDTLDETVEDTGLRDLTRRLSGR